MKILLIEDDKSIAKIIGLGLGNQRIDVHWSETGTRGLNMISANVYDLIILDLMLDDKNGDELCRQIRIVHPQLPIIVLTALSDLNSKIKLFNLGADDYMTKPFEFEELYARIKSALRKQKIEIGDHLSLADITIDLKRHEVRRHGILIELREKEIKILEYLIRHAGQVMTRDMILNYVWGPTVERYTNVVDVHMHHLREKIDKPYATKLLKTVNNVGYKISKPVN